MWTVLSLLIDVADDAAERAAVVSRDAARAWHFITRYSETLVGVVGVLASGHSC